MTLTIPKLATLIEEYEADQLAHAADSTRKSQTVALAQARRELPDFPTVADVRDWLGGKIQRHEIMATTANAYAAYLSRCISAATERHAMPNWMRAFTPFPVPPKARRALQADEAGGRLAKVERLMALACRDSIERALLFLLYDTGFRIEEMLGLRLAYDLDLGRSRVHVDGQRSPRQAEHNPRTKTKGSRRWVNLSPEAVEWVRRALRDPVRMKFGGHWKGAAERDALAQAFLFPFRTRQLDDLLDRMREVEPESFRRRVRGERGGDAWHVFRHSLASDMSEVRDGDGRRVYGLEEIGERLGHTHSEWTRDYVESIRGRECETDLDPLRAHRAAQRAALHEAEGVADLGRHHGAGDAGGVGGALVRAGSGEAYGGRGRALASVPVGLREASGAGVKVRVVLAHDTAHEGRGGRAGAGGLESVGCRGMGRPAFCADSTTT